MIIALVSEGIKEAQEMLTRVENSAKRVGLSMNTGKTTYMSYNTIQQFEIKAIDGLNLKRVDDLKYLGAWIDSSAKYLKIRKSLAWRTYHQMRNIWKSTLNRKMKLRIMHTTIGSVLLYGCETWTLTKTLLKKLDGTYTRILRMILNVHWSQKVTNEVLYRAIEKISTKIRRRFLKFAGHCLRRDDEVVSDLVLWEPTHGTRRRGRPPESYIRNLENETGIPSSEMRVAMMNRAVWRLLLSGKQQSRNKQVNSN